MPEGVEVVVFFRKDGGSPLWPLRLPSSSSFASSLSSEQQGVEGGKEGGREGGREGGGGVRIGFESFLLASRSIGGGAGGGEKEEEKEEEAVGM